MRGTRVTPSTKAAERMEMRAFRVLEPNQTAVVEVERPVPAPHELLIKVAAAGVCHSDVVLRGMLPGLSPGRPWTLGHEIAGTVEAVGSAVVGFALGDEVAVYQLQGCGVCRQCRRGADNLCPHEF